VDLIMYRKSHSCYELLNKAKALNSDILIIQCLVQAFRNLLLLKNDGGGKGVCERTGLTGWLVSRAIQFDPNFSIEECEKNLLFLQDVEMQYKTGGVEQGIVLDYILAEVL